MKDHLDRVLEVGSQREAAERFEERAIELQERAPYEVDTF
jgi:hypothetical protein